VRQQLLHRDVPPAWRGGREEARERVVESEARIGNQQQDRHGRELLAE
jgi:hypothetical protein